MGVRIHFLGCGDAFASGGRFQTTFLVEVPGAGPGVERFLIDCGATALIALKRAGLATGDVPLVLVTHHLEEIPPGFTHALVLKDGSTLASGHIVDVVTSEVLSDAFDLKLRVESDNGRYTVRLG